MQQHEQEQQQHEREEQQHKSQCHLVVISSVDIITEILASCGFVDEEDSGCRRTQQGTYDEPFVTS